MLFFQTTNKLSSVICSENTKIVTELTNDNKEIRCVIDSSVFEDHLFLNIWLKVQPIEELDKEFNSLVEEVKKIDTENSKECLIELKKNYEGINEECVLNEMSNFEKYHLEKSKENDENFIKFIKDINDSSQIEKIKLLVFRATFVCFKKFFFYQKKIENRNDSIISFQVNIKKSFFENIVVSQNTYEFTLPRDIFPKNYCFSISRRSFKDTSDETIAMSDSVFVLDKDLKFRKTSLEEEFEGSKTNSPLIFN